MTTYYRNEYLFSEIYLQEITQQPEDTEILASLTTLKEYREFARTATIQEWKESFVHEVLYALRFGVKSENESLTLLYPVGNMETPLTLSYALLPTEDLNNTTMGRNWAEKVIRSLRQHNLKWGILTNGEQWRMYHLDESTPYEIFLEINLAAILSDSASQAYQIFHKFMKVENFTTDGNGQCRLDVFKKESLAKIDYIESELANALKQKEEDGKGVLSNLCMGYVEFLKSTGATNFDDDALRRKIYHGAMLYMFRLLFLFYADARGLLNETNSSLLKDVLRRSKASSANNTSASGYSIWEDLERIFVDIDQSYNGGLFDPHESEFTQFIEESRVNNSHLATALHYLTSYQERSGEEKAISYRDMSVRHLGTLYEGLLEHKLFITKEDTEVRAVKDKIQFIPASQGGRIVAGRYIPAGQVYFGSDRSERKATGSYYTPEYIVDYIVRNTVGEKLSQLRQDFLAGQKDLLSAVAKAIDQKERKSLTELLEDNLKTFVKEKILKLSVLDPAMGSGHFLVNTSNYIANFITEILNEFEIIGTTETSTTHWRRWVVENCVYGVDVNPLAVELAKLSLWILSMSKEKPLSFLNHNLKTGNSLIGARLDDIGKYPGKGEKKQRSIFSDDRDFKEAVGKAISNYARITSTDSATLDVIADKKAWLDEIDEILKPYKLVCDMHTSIYFGNEISEWKYKELIDSKDSILTDNDLPFYFHWELEFPEILLNRKGFIVVASNPPYLKEMDNKGIFEPVKRSDYAKYYQGKMDFWYFFLHRAIDVLAQDCFIGFITNSYFLKSAGASKLIQRIKEELVIVKAVDMGDIKVFENVSGRHVICLYQKSNEKDFETTYIVPDKNGFSNRIVEQNKRALSNRSLITEDYKINFQSEDVIIFRNCISLGEIYDVSQGVVEAPDKISRKLAALDSEANVGEGVFVLSKPELESLNLDPEENRIIKKYLNSSDIGKYYIQFNDEYLIYSDKEAKEKIRNNKYPNIKTHLDRMGNYITSSNKPYGLHRPRENKYFESPKLICKGMFLSPEFCYDEEKYYVGFSFSVMIKKDHNYSLKFLLGILNSNLGRYWFNNNGKKRGVGVDIGVLVFRQFPVYKATHEQQKQIEHVVERMLTLNRDFYASSCDEGNKQSLQAEIEEVDYEINQKIYEIYKLNQSEIEMIESA